MIEYVVLVIDDSWHCDTVITTSIGCDPMHVSKADPCNN